MNNSLLKIGIIFSILFLLLGTNIMPCSCGNIGENNDKYLSSYELEIAIIKSSDKLALGINGPNGPPEEWNKTFGGSEYDRPAFGQPTSDGGYIITGMTRSFGSGGSDIWLVKTDAYGNKLWDKTFGGSETDYAESVIETNDKCYVITGSTYSFGSGISSLFLIKVDSNGNKLWEKFFGGDSVERGRSIQLVSDGGYIITGETWSYGSGGVDIWLIKTDANGNKIWDRTFGGSGNEFGNCVQQTIDGGFILVGTTDSFSTDLTEIWLIKTDANGNEIWDKTFGESIDFFGNSVQQTIDGGYIITGGKDVYYGYSDLLLIKTDSYGNKIWDETFPGPGEDIGNSVQQTTDGGYIITGTTTGGDNFDPLLLKTDDKGNKMWEKKLGKRNYGDDDMGVSVQQTLDGGYILTASTSSFGAGELDFWLVKIRGNEPPNKPACSYDSISDKLSITATDLDGDKVRYGISWNNNQNVDQWTGLGNSGTQQKIDCGGRIGTVGVITEDEHGAQSDWVSQKSKNKAIDHSFLQFLENHPYLFPLLQQLLNLQ